MAVSIALLTKEWCIVRACIEKGRKEGRKKGRYWLKETLYRFTKTVATVI